MNSLTTRFGLPTRFRIRSFQKFFGKWQPSYLGWHWVQDMVYLDKRGKTSFYDRMFDKIEWMLQHPHSELEAYSIEVRLIEEIPYVPAINEDTTVQEMEAMS